MTTAPSTTLVTVAYNSAHDLARYWANGRPADAEWIVVDNASIDDSVAVAEALGARVIRLRSNSGFGAACNVGLHAARTPVVGFVNPDVRVDPRDFPALELAVGRGGRLVAPQLLNLDGSPQPNGRGTPSLVNKVLNRLHPHSAAERGFRLFAGAGEEVEVHWLTGATIFALRDDLLALGGFGQEFFLYYEDVDLCMRASARGMTCVVLGDLRWVHAWARAASGFNLRGWANEVRSGAKFYRKYPRLAFGAVPAARITPSTAPAYVAG